MNCDNLRCCPVSCCPVLLLSSAIALHRPGRSARNAQWCCKSVCVCLQLSLLYLNVEPSENMLCVLHVIAASLTRVIAVKENA